MQTPILQQLTQELPSGAGETDKLQSAMAPRLPLRKAFRR